MDRVIAVSSKPETLSPSEQVAIVDSDDNVVGSASRSVMRKYILPHRATYIFLKSSTGEFYIQKRSNLKDYCPGFYDPVSGGVVEYNEDPAENAQRELEEEMGVTGISLPFIFKFYFEDERCKVWGYAYEGCYDGDLTLQKEEVDSVTMLTLEAVLEEARTGEKDFTPDGLHAVREYLRRKKSQNTQD